MDVFERVRDVNAGMSLTEDRIIGARARLLEGIDAGRAAERKQLTRRPMFLIAGAVAGVAAATAGVVVITQLTAPSPQVEAVPAPTADPRQPGEVLPHPAPTGGTGITEPFPGTTPQAGQYLRIDTVFESLLYRGPEVSTYQWFYRPTQYPPISAALLRSFSSLTVPADRSGEWVGSYGPSNERIRFYPEDQGPGGEAAWDTLLPVRPDIDQWTYTGGIGGETLPLTGSLESYAQYPQDPAALLQYFRDLAQGDPQMPDVEGSAVLNVAGVLISNYAPAATRAIFLEALELSPRAEVVSADNGIVTYRMHVDGWQGPSTTTVSIDTSTGWVTESTVRFDRADGAEGDMAPSDVPDIRRTFTVSIVDAIP
ncbi:hypothetical protein [Microbacterium sp. TPD7012]|uniref:hypothetical protein n=1 Tax=Microbacterium sp. TPD7012 TaxID=2171975 RepID=UPI000D5103F6|nr:hypothetical protein [Microbacterium sp. TPD7012]PVE91652.1 hypothetical protein DC434_18745 [Microbacterium sp. TPD7012]